MPTLDPLVIKAMHYQQKLGITDERFAVDYLKITPGYWSKLKSGTAKGTGGKFVRSMFTRFPDLAFSLPSDMQINKPDLHQTV